MLDDVLSFLVQAQEAPNWARLGEHLPYEWIEQAGAYSGKASIRPRRLPAEQVVWLVVALALYRHQSISYWRRCSTPSATPPRISLPVIPAAGKSRRAIESSSKR